MKQKNKKNPKMSYALWNDSCEFVTIQAAPEIDKGNQLLQLSRHFNFIFDLTKLGIRIVDAGS